VLDGPFILPPGVVSTSGMVSLERTTGVFITFPNVKNKLYTHTHTHTRLYIFRYVEPPTPPKKKYTIRHSSRFLLRRCRFYGHSVRVSVLVILPTQKRTVYTNIRTHETVYERVIVGSSTRNTFTFQLRRIIYSDLITLVR